LKGLWGLLYLGGACSLAGLLVGGCGGDSGSEPAPQATKLVFLNQPGTVEGQVAWDPPIRVALQTTTGTTVTGASADVTLSLATNPAGAALSGTTTVRAVNGIATFSDLALALPGDGFVLKAESAGLTSALGAAFSVRITFAHVSVGNFHSCGVTTTGFAYCWGQNAGGQLGTGTLTAEQRPSPVSGGLHFAEVSAGDVHTCGVTTTNVAYCWGVNDYGRLGDGTTTQHGVPTLVAGGLLFSHLSAGETDTCGVTMGGDAYCWGLNDAGQLGDAVIGQHPVPGRVMGGLHFSAVSAGGMHSCGITSDDIGYCWGDNGVGQLGDGTTTSRADPEPVAGGLRWRQLSAGGIHSCGVTTGNTVLCWGFNNHGQLGDGTMTEQHAPISIMTGQQIASVTTGRVNSCAITATGAASCWGINFSGQLGDGTIISPRPMPTLVQGGLGFAQLSARGEHTCGVTIDHVAYCWGFNAEGELGNGTDQSSLTPARIAQ